MAEGGEDYISDNEYESDDLLFDSGSEDSSEDGEDTDDVPSLNDEEETEDEDDKRLRELELALLDEEPEKLVETDDLATEEYHGDPRPKITKNMFLVDKFYGEEVRAIHLNILTDFVDAEIFLIDGDSLLLELLGEKTLDWSNGGQFLHLTYLLERFLQYFTDKGGVFHIVFFKDMEVIWTSQPSMLLARHALILHLQHNTNFTVVTSIDNFWGEQWREYVDDKIPAFLLLTDAENIPWETKEKKQESAEFFFRSLLYHSLGQGLNCVFISGIEMTATKVMGFYTEASSSHKVFLRTTEGRIRKTWQFLMASYKHAGSPNGPGCSGTAPIFQIDLKERVQTALKSPPEGGCRELITILACSNILCKFLNDPNITKERMKANEDRTKFFLLHSVLLNKLPLRYRAHKINQSLLDRYCQAKDGQVFPFQEFHINLWEILKLVHEEYPSMTAAGFLLDMTSVADLMDGRLLHTLFQLVLEQKSVGLQARSFPEDVIKQAETAWSKVVAAVNSDVLQPQFFPLFAENIEVTGFRRTEEGSSDSADSRVKLRSLLDVGNDLVNEYAGEIRTKINAMAEDDGKEEIFESGREFDELYHWHTLKPLTDDYDRTKQSITEKPPDDRKKRYWFYKNKQTYVRFLHFYGNSLEGGIDRAKVITVNENGAGKKKGKDKTGKVGKKQEKYIEENKQRRKGEALKKEQDKWNNVSEAVEPHLNGRNYDVALELINEFLTSIKFPRICHAALMTKAKCCFGAWQDQRYGDPNTNDMKYPVLLMETAQEIAQQDEKEEKGSPLTDKDKKKLAGYMQKLGFEDLAASFCELNADSKERAGDQLSVHQTSARFQLEHIGHLLKRDERNDPDPRVDHFIPDTWQRELLDAVDNNESAVIVAPTSSGKTYASYYCMEKVLRESDDGVVVYVSPTKALVNQVAATIYAHFHRKQLPEGRAVFGVFTRDYRYNTLNSQILVTVPQCLEILFISPRRQHWTKNVKYVIFDEVHCLGQEIGAEVWEHLLLLIRCPFLALSATIGNPDDLLAWLQAAQDFREQQDKQEIDNVRKSYKVNLVTCNERYSDLEKSIYLPSPSNGGFSRKTRKYEDHYDITRTDEFVRLHPCAQLVTKQLMENGFPGDMALTPKEALQLYDVMVRHWPEKESLQKLSPEQYFQEQSFIPKNHARQYERELKKEFKSWADDKQLAKVEAVIQSLNYVFLEKKAFIDEEWSKVKMPSSGKEFVRKNFPKLIEQLKAQGKLPALVFSFDRDACEKMANSLATEFEKREKHLREQENQRNLKLAKDRKQHDQAQKLLKRQRDLIEKIKKGDRYHPLLEQVTIQEVKEKEYAARNEPLPECTLAFTHGIGNEKLKKIIDRIQRPHAGRKKKKRTISFKNALRRGISYHHAGLDNKKRSCVEMLFRERYLQVVTATGTLALGIHMPCKTVVLAGDSPFLNSLQYRQMSGRAGRRGFDPVGNVVFFGVPYRKVQRLITANIPWLVGNFPINVSLVLRLLLMTSKGDDKDDALTKALALLSHPFICRKYPEMESQIKKHFLFSVELLARLGLINRENGAPQEMAGLATHLHYYEPANFVLVSFLQRGLFHKLCKRQRNSGKFSEDVMRNMVLVLNFLFARRFLHANFVRRIDECPSSKVILDDLPDDFAKALQDYNNQVTSVFSQYLTTVAAEIENDRGEEQKLPLSGIEFPNQASIAGVDENGTIKKLGLSSVPYCACSSFAALSGNSDLELEFMGQKPAAVEELEESSVASRERRKKKKKMTGSKNDKSEKREKDSVADHQQPIDHLLKIVRQGVYTDMNVVPILPLKKYDSSGCVLRLNSFALDFYKHGSSEAIVDGNEIKSGDVFFALKDFCLTIKSISCSLEDWGPENDSVVLAFKQLAQEFGEKFKSQFGTEI